MHRPTPETRALVTNLADLAMAHDWIARHLGISRNTLAKHYGQELSAASARREMRVAVAMMKAAERGNVTAMRWVIDRWHRAEREERGR